MKATCKPDNFWDLFFSLDRVSLCSPGCLGTYSIDQAQTHRDSTVAASRVPSVPPLLSKICLFIYWDRVSLCSFIDWLIETGFLCVALAVLEEKKKNVSEKKRWPLLQEVEPGAGEMAQRVRALTALPKVLSSNPSNHMMAHNHP